jgi:hypothetical protein
MAFREPQAYSWVVLIRRKTSAGKEFNRSFFTSFDYSTISARGMLWQVNL